MPPAPSLTTPALGGSRWNTFPAAGSSMTARQFFTATEPLLQGVIDDNALTSADGEVLEAQIRATLGLGTRETSLPLAVGPESAPAARELGAQAESVGRELASWATAALERLLTERIPLPAGPLVVRSHCYGHLLTPAAADLLLRRRGGPVTMQLYNEWLHQVVLLRDALLPFTNWQDVPLRITPAGLRHLEPARDGFLTELLVRQIRHSSVVDFARHAVTGGTGGIRPASYGFDTAGGTVLPAVLDQPALNASRYLLTWRPGTTVEETVSYLPGVQDYYSAPRTPVEELPPATAGAGPLTARTVLGPVADGARTAHLEVTDDDGTMARVDLGQALRGHRFARRVTRRQEVTADGAPADPGSRTAHLRPALRAPGLVWTRSGEVTLDATGQDGLVVLALLGRLYPENVVLRPNTSRVRTAVGGGELGRLVVELSDPDATDRTGQ
ncbi:hypothetical protein [Streptomyces sp. NPDC050535]|uniref:hypothetical protein n=1 Tax=Streptomyces sp. NPDC050535 TaxID=3365626 RepID=UPI0037B65A1B